MLKAGRIVALDTKQKLLSTFAGLTVRLTVAEPLPGALAGRACCAATARRTCCRWPTTPSSRACSRRCAKRDITIIELSLQEADLEQVFLRIMARQE